VLLELHGWIPDLVAAHLEELEFLWPQWAEARRLPDYLVPELSRLEERIAANLDALVLAGDEAEPLIEDALDAASPALVRSAAMVMLHRDPSAYDVLLGRLAEAGPSAALALAEALGALEPGAAVDRATEVAIEAQTPAAVLAAAWTLALWGRPVPGPERVRLYLTEPDPLLRVAAWRLAGELLARGELLPLARSEFEAALADEDTADAAWWAAAWSRQAWLLSHASAQAAVDVRALSWLARLGGSGERARVLEALEVDTLGPARFAAAARLGHVDIAEALLRRAADAAPERAVPAAHAFWRITDVRKILDTSVQLVGPDGDPDLAETAHLPDVPALRQAWTQLRPSFAAGSRWARAVDVDRVEPAQWAVLDCEARDDRLVREVYRGVRAPELAAWSGAWRLRLDGGRRAG
jgi:hypothetical protein